MNKGKSLCLQKCICAVKQETLKKRVFCLLFTKYSSVLAYRQRQSKPNKIISLNLPPSRLVMGIVNEDNK